MKKNLFLVSALVMGMMSSCSSDVENVTVPGSDQSLQPVELLIGDPQAIVTRSVGTVGGINGAGDNRWNGEDLYLNMMCYYDNGADTWSVSKWTKIDENGLAKDIENFNNVKVNAPASGTQGDLVIQASAGGEGRYYPPTSSKHQFFAYHIDDAIIGSDYTSSATEPVVVDDETGKTRKVYFKIDGSQDLMVGEAVAKTDAGELSDYLFSAKSARAGIIPVLQMKHLLTRFTFNVKTDVTNSQLKVQKIIVKSKNKGKMCVAYAEKPASLLEFVDGEIADFELKERGNGVRTMQALTPVALDAQFKSVGEALMVAPGEDTYDITIVASQEVGTGTTTTHTFSYNSQIKVAGGALAGSSYKVNITLYGLQDIKIEAQLTGWDEANGEINLIPGEDF